MAKTNFTKVEGILDEGLRRIAVNRLLESTPKSQDTNNPDFSLRTKTILALQRDLKYLEKEDQEPYSLFGIDKKNIKKYLKDVSSLTSDDWNNIKDVQVKVQKFKKEYEKNAPKKNDDLIIEQQRAKHKTKRFNINDKWLPLS